jgi:hypothetical protein
MTSETRPKPIFNRPPLPTVLVAAHHRNSQIFFVLFSVICSLTTAIPRQPPCYASNQESVAQSSEGRITRRGEY